MSNGVKALMVVTGLFGFFFVAIAGPGLEFAGDTVIKNVLGHDKETELENNKVRSMKVQDGATLSTKTQYSSEGDLGRARHCCQACDRDWSHEADQCEDLSQQAAKCVAECGSCLVVPAADNVKACCLISTKEGVVNEDGQCQFSKKTDRAGEERSQYNLCMNDLCAKRATEISTPEKL